MPNWVTNFLTINKENAKYVVNNDGHVDFNLLLPMPENLSRTISPAPADCMAYYYLTTHTKAEFFAEDLFKSMFNFTISAIKQYWTKKKIMDYLLEHIGSNPRMYNDEIFGTEEFNHTPEEVGKFYMDLYNKYRVYDWYEWRYRFWGCKWNASDTQVCEETETTITYKFDTPWCTPMNWLEILAIKMPYHLAWLEEQGFRGVIVSYGDEEVENIDLPDLTWEKNDDDEYKMVDEEFPDSDWTRFKLDEVSF